MFKRTSAILCVSALAAWVGPAQGGEFVTQEKPSSDRAVPFCSSTLGCFLSGVGDLPKTQLIPDRLTPLASPSRPAPEPAAPPPRTGLPIIVAAEHPEIDRLRRLVALAPDTNVKIVEENGRTSRKRIDFQVVTDLNEADSDKAAGLFEDEMHILAGPDIRVLADLTDKVVSYGPENSEGQAVGRRAFEALHIPVKETPLDLDNALDGLSTGDIAAVIVLAPPPVARLRQLRTAGLHLMPWPAGVPVPAGADVSSIDPQVYPRLAVAGTALPALGVTSILRRRSAQNLAGIDEVSLAASLRAVSHAQ